LRYFLKIFFLLLLLNAKAQESGFATSSDSTKIFYRTYGKGKPLLIINGGPGMNSDGFEDLAKQLSQNYQTIIYDQRGTGKSKLKTLDSTSVTMKLMLDDIEALRKKFQLNEWIVLGHSFGGMLSSYYATTFPDKIERMILSSSGGIDLDLLNYVSTSINSKLRPTALDSLKFISSLISAGDSSHSTLLKRGKILAPAYVIDPKFLPVIAERLTQSNSKVNSLIWEDLSRINFDCAEKLKSFTKPVLIIQGKEDIIKSETAVKAQKVLKNSKLVLMDHCIHYGWLDNKEVYFKEIHELIGGS
jgi:proline iminopeptidase